MTRTHRLPQLVSTTLASALLGVLAPVATAATPRPTRIANVANATQAIQSYVDRSGTVHVAWLEPTAGGDILRYVRKPASAKSFTAVAIPLPAALRGVSSRFFLYQRPAPASDVRIVFGESATSRGVYVADSPNGGVTWSTSAVASLATWFLIDPSQLASGSGGLVGVALDWAGTREETLIRVRDDLSGFDVVEPAPYTVDGEHATTFAVAGNGTVFAVARAGTQHWQVGASKGALAVPGCSSIGAMRVAAGATDAVIVVSGCNGVWAATLSAAGSIGPLRAIGSRSVEVNDVLALVYAGGRYTAAWLDASGDLRVARSSTGSAWKTETGQLPVAQRLDGVIGELSHGAPTWFAWGIRYLAFDVKNRAEVNAAPLAALYRAPAVSKRGIASAKVGRQGLAAIVVPAKVKLAKLRRSGKIAIRLAVGYDDWLRVSISSTRPIAGGVLGVLGAEKFVRIAPGRAKMLTFDFRLGSALSQSRKGDRVEFRLEGRNGTVTVVGKLT